MRTITTSWTKAGLFSVTIVVIASVIHQQQHLGPFAPSNSRSHGLRSAEFTINETQSSSRRRMRRRKLTSCENSSQNRRCSKQSEAASKTSDAVLLVPWCCNSRKTLTTLPPLAQNWAKSSLARPLSELAAKALKLGHMRIGWSTAVPVVTKILHAATVAAAPAGSQPNLRDLITRGTDSAADKQTTRWFADANSQATIWVQGGNLVQEHPARARPFFTWSRISEIFFFSVYAQPRLADVEFSDLLTNITEETWGKRPSSSRGERVVNGVGMSSNKTACHHSPGRARPPRQLSPYPATILPIQPVPPLRLWPRDATQGGQRNCLTPATRWSTRVVVDLECEAQRKYFAVIFHVPRRPSSGNAARVRAL
ncbi:unnamed protein product [Trichogramma brassicae]|uniref:Uncharacterized protein n=1 Tax=Trichogramma brassicae TaxID=86971 RepID=A0A6H5IYF8_9HYME|nr:unnamed protein product [Trichogramma brassicae]